MSSLKLNFWISVIMLFSTSTYAGSILDFLNDSNYSVVYDEGQPVILQEVVNFSGFYGADVRYELQVNIRAIIVGGPYSNAIASATVMEEDSFIARVQNESTDVLVVFLNSSSNFQAAQFMLNALMNRSSYSEFFNREKVYFNGTGFYALDPVSCEGFTSQGIYVLDSFNVNSVVFTDFCINNFLYQLECFDGELIYADYACEIGCSNGICLAEATSVNTVSRIIENYRLGISSISEVLASIKAWITS